MMYSLVEFKLVRNSHVQVSSSSSIRKKLHIMVTTVKLINILNEYISYSSFLNELSQIRCSLFIARSVNIIPEGFHLVGLRVYSDYLTIVTYERLTSITIVILSNCFVLKGDNSSTKGLCLH